MSTILGANIGSGQNTPNYVANAAANGGVNPGQAMTGQTFNAPGNFPAPPGTAAPYPDFNSGALIDPNAGSPSGPPPGPSPNWQSGQVYGDPSLMAAPQAPGATPAPAVAPPAPGGAPPLPYQNVGGLPPNAPPPPGPPLNIAPQLGATPVATPPPGAMVAPPPTAAGGLARQLGIAPPGGPPTWETALATGMAGLGRGLSAVGAARPGASGAQMFAAGAGGALQGGTAFQQQQQAQQRQAKLDAFNMSSGYFKDMIAAKQEENMEAYRQAQAKFLGARATNIQNGGTGTNAWQNTPYGKTIQVENEAQKYEKGQQIILQKRWALNGTSPDQQQADIDQLQKNVDGYRQRLYKTAGINPDDAQKLKDMGTSPDNAFDTKGMTLQQFNDQVPMSGWYKDQNGVVRQRTVPPPNVEAAGQPQQQQPSGQQDYYATMMAMQPTQ
jgi:hypothetical protein